MADLCSEDMMAQITPTVSVLSEGGGARGFGSAELGRRLLLAARHGDTQLVLDLMAKGAPFTTDWLGTSALHAAASGAHTETCAVLLRAGVSRDCRTKVDRTPLHMAAHAGHAEVAQLLLEHRACVDCRDMLHMSPLHWAAERGHAAVAAVLLRHGADPRARSKFNKTPLGIARARARPDLLRLMEDALREREAASETEESTASEQQRTLDATERLTEAAAAGATSNQTQPEPIKINLERPLGGAWCVDGAGVGAGAALLRRHGIAPLPADGGSTVLSALQSGRRVVLSDAGKLMLKESDPGEPKPPAAAGSGAAAPTPAPAPARGLNVFTLGNKLLALPKANLRHNKLINSQNMQIKFVHVPSDKKLPVTKTVEMKAKAKPVAPAPGPAPRPAPVRITMQKANLAKLLPPAKDEIGLDAEEKSNPNVVFVPEAFLTNNSPKYLRAQLLAAHRTIAALHAQLARRPPPAAPREGP